MNLVRVDVVVVGGGQAGLGAAYRLVEAGLDVVVLERGQVGESWRSQRWDSFALNTPNWMNGLPGAEYAGSDPFGFMTHTELAESFERYVDRFDLPVRTGVTVTGVGSADGESRYAVTGQTADGEALFYAADSVVIASGILQEPRLPPASSHVPDRIVQLHTGTYRSPDVLPPGAVVVVGGGQSGAQIVEDLLNAGRAVYFSISKVARVPRRYRGRDFMDWWVDMGLWDLAAADADPDLLRATNPLVSGVGALGHSVSYQQLARRGVRLMGRLETVEDGVLTTDDRVPEYLRNADERSAMLRSGIDAYIEKAGVSAPAPEPDEGDMPLGPDEDVEFLTTLNLDEAGVSAIVWATGFTADFSWIDLPVTDERGTPTHVLGASDAPGIYFIGFPWLSKRKSGIVFGIDDDATTITSAIVGEARVS